MNILLITHAAMLVR